MDDISPNDSLVTAGLPYHDAENNEALSTPLDNPVEARDSGRSLADRIGNTKVYLLSDAMKSRGKRRRDDSEDTSQDVEMAEGESPFRDNAILLHGTPISHLPTTNIFAYATHFEAHPLGLEWIDDITCILVFESSADARSAFRSLQKSFAEELALDDGSVTAKPIPVAIWPAKDRIDATIGQSAGLKGILRMRWAQVVDVKKRGAKKESEFYKKYGHDAGKTFEDGPSSVKRRRSDNTASDAAKRAQLDEELDNFLAEDEDAPPPSPPSRMRSDYIGKDGRTLLERTSLIRSHPEMIASPAELPRRARPRRDGGERSWDDGKLASHQRSTQSGGGRRTMSTHERRPARPKVTQEDLDAELDAFLNAKD